jgi:16S rRNA (guanine966-N2)-methyltransferase
MRIISGKFKGHHLVSFKADHIRPTTDRVKETMYNILIGEIENARVLDLFSGTGNLGLEALSRGAQEVIFVEKNKSSIAILEKNLEKLKVTSGYKIIHSDVISFLKKFKGEAFDVIFADPPFTEAMAHDVLLAANSSSVFKESTIMTIESAKKERLDDDYGNLFRYDLREFGDKNLSFFKLKETQN